ncbi:MAG: yesS [Paenibacillaceae bacterium]|nr:yesS [Paenibacillaceae bacterium]
MGVRFHHPVGQGSACSWAYAHEQVGDVIRFAPDSPVVRSLETIYSLASAKAVRNGYAAAGLATQFLMEPYQFSRLFHRTTGLTAMQYLTKVRLEKSMELLRNTDMTLQEIALATGYSYDNYFNKVFRKSTGLSPGQFRRGEASIPKMDHIAFDFS